MEDKPIASEPIASEPIASEPIEPARSHQGHTFLSASEKQKLRRLAASSGMTQSAFLRKLVVEQPEPLTLFDVGPSGLSPHSSKESA